MCNLSKTNSFFLFGPRGSGKTSLLQDQFSLNDTVFIDLLDVHFFDQLMLDVRRFEAVIDSADNREKRVVVDEIQKFPKLLDIIHSQIQKRKRQFVLTGSSSRRLKQAGTNLLAGRAWVYNLYPFSSNELGKQFDLKKALERGLLPEAYLAKSQDDSREYLNAYVGTYLQKEIQQEQWVKNLVPFRKFLAIAAQMNGKIINKSKIAKEIGIDDVTVSNYLEILEDTLIGFLLPAFSESVRQAQKHAPKFYFIDPGIKRGLEGTLSVPLLKQTYMWGDAFEHFLILEIIKNASYQRKDWQYSYLRTKDDVEIDLIIKRPGEKKLLIEIKSKEQVFDSDAKSLETLGNAVDAGAEKWILTCDPIEQKFGTTQAMHWQSGINRLFVNS